MGSRKKNEIGEPRDVRRSGSQNPWMVAGLWWRCCEVPIEHDRGQIGGPRRPLAGCWSGPTGDWQTAAVRVVLQSLGSEESVSTPSLCCRITVNKTEKNGHGQEASEVMSILGRMVAAIDQADLLVYLLTVVLDRLIAKDFDLLTSLDRASSGYLSTAIMTVVCRCSPFPARAASVPTEQPGSPAAQDGMPIPCVNVGTWANGRPTSTSAQQKLLHGSPSSLNGPRFFLLFQRKRTPVNAKSRVLLAQRLGWAWRVSWRRVAQSAMSKSAHHDKIFPPSARPSPSLSAA